MRKTKIICTLGPAVDNDEMVRKLIQNGMNCAKYAVKAFYLVILSVMI